MVIPSQSYIINATLFSIKLKEDYILKLLKSLIILSYKIESSLKKIFQIVLLTGQTYDWLSVEPGIIIHNHRILLILCQLFF